MTTTAQKLAAARERLARAESRAGVTSDRVSLPDDPGALSGIRRTTTARQARKTAAAVDRSVDAAVERVAAQKEVERLEMVAGREKRDQKIRDDYANEDYSPQIGDTIRYERYGSPRGVGIIHRLNRTTVTLEAPWPMDKPKVAYDRILGLVKEPA